MIIHKTMPYIIKKANNTKEFIQIQKILIAKGYRWLDYDAVDNAGILRYSPLDLPIYISNLEFVSDIMNERIFNVRLSQNELNNNIIFCNMKEKFNIKDLRSEKLKQLWNTNIG